MFKIIAAAAKAVGVFVLFAVGLVWGAFWSMVRDQDVPSWTMTEREKNEAKAAGRYFRKWKEIGIAAVGVLPGLVAWAAYGWHEGAIVYAGTAAAWSLPHDISDKVRKLLGKPEIGAGFGLDMLPGNDCHIHAAEAWLNMMVTGMLVTASAAGVMFWHGDILSGLLALLAGAMKPVLYRIAYVIVGVPLQPHADAKPVQWYSFWGHVASGALALGVTMAVLSAGL